MPSTRAHTCRRTCRRTCRDARAPPPGARSAGADGGVGTTAPAAVAKETPTSRGRGVRDVRGRRPLPGNAGRAARARRGGLRAPGRAVPARPGSQPPAAAPEGCRVPVLAPVAGSARDRGAGPAPPPSLVTLCPDRVHLPSSPPFGLRPPLLQPPGRSSSLCPAFPYGLSSTWQPKLFSRAYPTESLLYNTPYWLPSPLRLGSTSFQQPGRAG